jgi:hypothetical protein
MFRLTLIESRTRAPALGQGSLVSLAFHAVVVGAWVASAIPGAADPTEPHASRIQFLVPPDRVRSREVHQERLEWIAVGSGGAAGTALHDAVQKSEFSAKVTGHGDPTPDPGDTKEQEIPQLESPKLSDVMTVLEVDSAVARDPNSAAPPYPPDMLKEHIEGSASVQFIVDTTGVADTASFQILAATHPAFARSVRETLPLMRFHPAVLQSRKVRQLVQQMFSFKIEQPAAPASPPTTKRPGTP